MTNLEGIEILLVEDNQNDVELTLLALKKHNLANKVHVVEDGAMALDYLFCEGVYADRTSGAPRVVLLDLKLPKVDGLEVLKALRSNEATKRIPVVLLTSSREERDVARSYDLGVNSYIVKPIDFNSFVSCISELGFYWLILNNIPQSMLGYQAESQAEDQAKQLVA